MATDTREAAALRALMLEVFRLNGALLRHGADLTAPLGQTQARWQVIGAVAEAERTVPQIARRMGMSRQGVQRVADLLKADGLITYDQNPDHARSPLLRLTKRGARVERQLSDAGSAWSRAISDGLSARDLDRAISVVRALIKRLDDREEEDT